LQYHIDKDTALLGLLEFIELLGSTSVRGLRHGVKGSRQKEQEERRLCRNSEIIDSMSAFFDHKSAFLRECL
jgi:hypothetical protein